MKLLKFIINALILLLTLNEAGYMVVDGCMAFFAGDYITPSEGEFAGQLGPWHHLVEAIGIPARSALMKTIFIVIGLAWIGTLVAFFLKKRWAWMAMLCFSIGTLWYLWIGTINSTLLILLLIFWKIIHKPNDAN